MFCRIDQLSNISHNTCNLKNLKSSQKDNWGKIFFQKCCKVSDFTLRVSQKLPKIFRILIVQCNFVLPSVKKYLHLRNHLRKFSVESARGMQKFWEISKVVSLKKTLQEYYLKPFSSGCIFSSWFLSVFMGVQTLFQS